MPSVRQIEKGMIVRDADGRRLGRVFAVEGPYLYFTKGLFSPRDYRATLDEVTGVEGRDVFLGQATAADAAPATAPAREAARPGELLRVPVFEEQVQVDKRVRRDGRVRVRKEVVEEMQTIQVPVRRERVVVERIEDDTPTAPDDIVLPLEREEAVASTRAVTREDVVLRKDVARAEETREVRLRREEVLAQSTGQVQRTDPPAAPPPGRRR